MQAELARDNDDESGRMNLVWHSERQRIKRTQLENRDWETIYLLAPRCRRRLVAIPTRQRLFIAASLSELDGMLAVCVRVCPQGCPADSKSWEESSPSKPAAALSYTLEVTLKKSRVLGKPLARLQRHLADNIRTKFSGFFKQQQQRRQGRGRSHWIRNDSPIHVHDDIWLGYISLW